MASFDTVGYADFDSIPGTLAFDDWGVDAALTQGTRADFSSTFYGPTALSVYRLTPSLVSGTQVFYGPTITTVRALTAGLFSNSVTVYAPTVLRGTIALSAPLVSDGDTVYAPVALYLEPEFAFPTADISNDFWTASSGSDLYAMVDETSANDSDYITTARPAICVLRLAPVVDPQSTVGQVLRVRAKSGNAATLIAKLKQGSTTIATLTQTGLSSGYTTYEMILSPAECDSITDYTDLRVELEAA